MQYKIENEQLTVISKTYGAELISVKDNAEGKEYYAAGTETGLPMVLFPNAAKLKDNTLIFTFPERKHYYPLTFTPGTAEYSGKDTLHLGEDDSGGFFQRCIRLYVMKIHLISGVVGINHRNAVFFSQIQCDLAHYHRVVHMDQIDLQTAKPLLDPRSQQIENRKITSQTGIQRTAANDKRLLLPVVSAVRREDIDGMSKHPQSLCQTFDGDGYAADHRLVVVGHH